MMASLSSLEQSCYPLSRDRNAGKVRNRGLSKALVLNNMTSANRKCLAHSSCSMKFCGVNE